MRISFNSDNGVHKCQIRADMRDFDTPITRQSLEQQAGRAELLDETGVLKLEIDRLPNARSFAAIVSSFPSLQTLYLRLNNSSECKLSSVYSAQASVVRDGTEELEDLSGFHVSSSLISLDIHLFYVSRLQKSVSGILHWLVRQVSHQLAEFKLHLNGKMDLSMVQVLIDNAPGIRKLDLQWVEEYTFDISNLTSLESLRIGITLWHGDLGNLIDTVFQRRPDHPRHPKNTPALFRTALTARSPALKAIFIHIEGDSLSASESVRAANSGWSALDKFVAERDMCVELYNFCWDPGELEFGLMAVSMKEGMPICVRERRLLLTS